MTDNNSQNTHHSELNNNNKLNIAVGSEVTMHFTIKLTDNSVAETTKKQQPSVFVFSEESFADPVEAELFGKSVGDKVRVPLTPEQGYGIASDANIHDLPLSKFPSEAEPKVGDIYSFTQPNGEELPGVIRQINADQITVDFNHPLAGKNLLVEIEILAVKPSAN